MSNTFESIIEEVDQIGLPKYSGTRVMMMPLDFADPRGSTPEFLSHWTGTIEKLVKLSEVEEGVGFITIDEAQVEPGQTHRRPGIHVDGVSPDGRAGGWGGGGGGAYGAGGMLLVSSKVGCRGWSQTFEGWPKPEGDCSHLKPQCDSESEVVLDPNRVYFLNPLAVHEPLPLQDGGRRQFVRLSFPSDAPWYEGYTENPLGIEPSGPIKPPRTAQMNYRR